MPDPSAYLVNDSYTERQWPRRSKAGRQTVENVQPMTCQEVASAGIFDPAPPGSRSYYPKLDGTVRPEHHSIRADERQRLQGLLQNAAVVGIVTDWGMGTSESIAGSIFGEDAAPSLQEWARPENVFVLNCDAVVESSELEIGFKQQFGVTLHQFAHSISDLKWSCIVLQGMQQTAIEGVHGDRLRSIIDLLLDYSDQLKILLTGRTEFWGSLPTIHLSALDLPETRSYLAAHPKGRSELLTVEAVERIHFSSGGLPVQIDSLLRRLEVASLDSVLEEHQFIDGDSAYFSALLRCIRQLGSETADQGSRRSLELLRALSHLPYGTTIELIKHFNRVHPFFPIHAEELHRLTLVDAVPIQYEATGISAHPTKAVSPSISPKILRVPKQVRDCVLGDMSDPERKQYVDLAAEFVFGDKWRSGGRIRLKKLPFEYSDHLERGPGNEFSVIRDLVAECVSEHGEPGINKALQLAVQYCAVLHKAERYKDLKMVAGPLIHMIEPLGFDSECRTLHRFCGRACRLTRSYSEAIEHFERAIDLTSAKGENEQHGRMLVELSSCYKAMNRDEDAKNSAMAAKLIAKGGSLLESQVRSKLVHFEDPSNTRESLSDIEQEARRKSWVSHANDMALVLAGWSNDDDKLQLYDRVIQSNEDGRNRYRAVVSKGKLLQQLNRLSRLTMVDEILLIKAYQYFHAQRMSEFNACHRVLWEHLEKKGQFSALYSMFRHSSFIWRLEGDLAEEMRYLERLSQIKNPENVEKTAGFAFEIAYFIKRSRILIVKVVSAPGKLLGPS